jgi:hypothetical protein
MGFDQYHEPPDNLPPVTRTFARLRASLTRGGRSDRLAEPGAYSAPRRTPALAQHAPPTGAGKRPAKRGEQDPAIRGDCTRNELRPRDQQAATDGKATVLAALARRSQRSTSSSVDGAAALSTSRLVAHPCARCCSHEKGEVSLRGIASVQASPLGGIGQSWPCPPSACSTRKDAAASKRRSESKQKSSTTSPSL